MKYHRYFRFLMIAIYLSLPPSFSSKNAEISRYFAIFWKFHRNLRSHGFSLSVGPTNAHLLHVALSLSVRDPSESLSVPMQKLPFLFRCSNCQFVFDSLSPTAPLGLYLQSSKGHQRGLVEFGWK